MTRDCAARHRTDKGAPDDLATLPELYAAALRLARVGTSPARIAADLGVPVEAVAGLLVLAEAKLTAAGRGSADTRRAAAEGVERVEQPGQDNSSKR